MTQPTNTPPIAPAVTGMGNRPSLESIFGTSSTPANRPSLASLLGTSTPAVSPATPSPTAPLPPSTMKEKASAILGGAAEGLGGTLALPVIDWAGRKIIESLPDSASFAGVTKAQMLENLDKSPELQKQFEELTSQDKAPTFAKTAEALSTVASLIVPVKEAVGAFKSSDFLKNAKEAFITDPAKTARDFSVGVKDTAVAKTKNLVSPADKIADVASSPEVHPFIAKSPENAKVVTDAVKQGFEPRDIKFLSTISEADKKPMQEMFDLAENGAGDLRAQYAGKRPADVVGDSVLQPLRELQKVNSAAGEAVDSTARALAGTPVDASQVAKTAYTEFEKAGVRVMSPEEHLNATAQALLDGKKAPSRFNYEKSAFKKTPAIQKQLDNALSDLPEGEMDAYDLHRFKKSIDQIVEFSKTSDKPMTRDAEAILKNIRHSADEVLDSNFANYNKANTDFRATRDVIDNAHEVMGAKTDFLDSKANMRVGQATRQLFNNATKRQDMFNFLQNLQETATKYGISTEKNPVDQALFAQVLESVYGTPAITGLQGEVGKAFRTGVRLLTDTKGTLVDKGIEAIEKLQGVSPEEKKRVLQMFLKTTEDIPKFFNSGAVPKTVEELVANATAYDSEYKKTVGTIAEELGFDVAHGPVKKAERIQGKIDAQEIAGVHEARDANRATLLVRSPKDLATTVEATKAKFGGVSRVKDKFGEGYDYKSAIINVKTPAGHEAEVAITTPHMWEAKTKLGGQKLYNVTRDKTGKYTDIEKEAAQAKMKALYKEAARLDGLLQETLPL